MSLSRNLCISRQVFHETILWKGKKTILAFKALVTVGGLGEKPRQQEGTAPNQTEGILNV
jgi:hypothetical protein